MPRSFIHRDKLTEYFGGTFALLDGELVKLRSFEFCDEGEDENEVESYCRVYYRKGQINNEKILDDCSTYDDVLAHITPYLPEAQYYTSERGEDFLLGYTTAGHYKRSMDMSRYYLVSSIDHVMVRSDLRGDLRTSDFNPPSRTLEEAMERAVASPNRFAAINPHYALLSYTRNRRRVCTLLYKDVQIGVVDEWGNVTLHRKYVHNFADKVSRFMGVTNV